MRGNGVAQVSRAMDLDIKEADKGDHGEAQEARAGRCNGGGDRCAFIQSGECSATVQFYVVFR